MNQEEYLKVFLTDGEVPIDNSACERALRNFTIGRKNWVTINTIRGAQASAVIYSITETARANDLNVYYYIRHLLTELPDLMNEDGTIEHIISEVEGDECLNIGNLILLENELNEEADSMKYCDKIATYKRSKYKWVKDFISKNPNWISTMILDRAKEMAECYYDNILKKDMDIS